MADASRNEAMYVTDDLQRCVQEFVTNTNEIQDGTSIKVENDEVVSKTADDITCSDMISDIKEEPVYDWCSSGDVEDIKPSIYCDQSFDESYKGDHLIKEEHFQNDGMCSDRVLQHQDSQIQMDMLNFGCSSTKAECTETSAEASSSEWSNIASSSCLQSQVKTEIPEIRNIENDILKVRQQSSISSPSWKHRQSLDSIQHSIDKTGVIADLMNDGTPSKRGQAHQQSATQIKRGQKLTTYTTIFGNIGILVNGFRFNRRFRVNKRLHSDNFINWRCIQKKTCPARLKTTANFCLISFFEDHNHPSEDSKTIIYDPYKITSKAEDGQNQKLATYTTREGNTGVEFNGFRFCRSGSSQNFKFWKCANSLRFGCTARLKTTHDLCLLGELKTHNHSLQSSISQKQGQSTNPIQQSIDNTDVIADPINEDTTSKRDNTHDDTHDNTHDDTHDNTHNDKHDDQTYQQPPIKNEQDLRLTTYTTKRGKTGVEYNGFKFTKHRQRKKYITWLCSDIHSCYVSLKTTHDLCLISTSTKSDDGTLIDSNFNYSSDGQQNQKLPTYTTKFGHTGIDMNGFRFHKDWHSKNYITWRCVHRKTCPAKLKTTINFCFISLSKEHNHSPEDTRTIDSYEITSKPEDVQSRRLSTYTNSRGNIGVELNGFRFSKDGHSKNFVFWRCAKEIKFSCSARLKTTNDFCLLGELKEHNHSPQC